MELEFRDVADINYDNYSELEFGPFLRPPKVSTTLTNLLTYWILLLARPVFFFFFSPASTLGVCPRTFPALAKDPWTFPPLRGMVTSTARFSRKPRLTSSSRGQPEQNRFNCSASTPSSRGRYIQNMGDLTTYYQLHPGFSCRSESSNKSLVVLDPRTISCILESLVEVNQAIKAWSF